MCYNPVRVRGQLFGCGHCLACLKQYQDQWTARLSEEAKCWRSDGIIPPIVFFTLKYRNDTIPCKYLYATSGGFDVSDVRPDSVPDVPIYDAWTDTRRESRSDFARRWSAILSVWDKHVSECMDLSGCNEFNHLPGSTPLFALEFHSVCKKDVQDWLKRGRIMAERKQPEIFGQDCNPRFKRFWTSADGSRHELPSAAVPKNVKYFLTSEYGPLTQRPHIHGIMFGITYNEFKKYFAADWEKRFGSIDFSAYDSSRGGMLYVSKYCSKGGYEHPYCSKDFFYAGSLKEYHSKDFENSIRDFSVNAALVEPTFHLISKGIGCGYCFNVELQKYFASQLEEYTTPSGRVNYRVIDNPDVPLPFPAIGLKESVSDSRVVEIQDTLNGFLIRKYAYPSKSEKERGITRGALIGESFLSADSIINSALENEFLNHKYNRIYVKGKSKTFHPAWHLIGHSVSEAKTSITSITLPRYFRRWLLSPLACAVRSSASCRLYPDLDAELSRIIQEFGPSDPRVAPLESLIRSNQDKQLAIAKKLRLHTQDFLHNSKF